MDQLLTIQQVAAYLGINPPLTTADALSVRFGRPFI